MWGPTQYSMFYVGFFLSVLSVKIAVVHNVKSDFKDLFQTESARFSRNLSLLNISSITILENLKHYEDTAFGSTLEGLKESNGSCSDAVGRTFFQIFEGKLWALKMLDSSSLLQSGLLDGNLWDLGAFDECLEVSVKEADLEFQGKHCLVNLNIMSTSSSSSDDTGVLAALGGSISYVFSVCLPSVCEPSSLANSLAAAAQQIDRRLSLYDYSVNFAVDASNCHTAESPPLTVLEIMGIVVPALFVVIAIVCTIVDLTIITPRNGNSLKGQPVGNQCVAAFSYYRNGMRLLDTSVSEDAIQILHSLKFLCIAWVAIGHRFKLSVQGPLVNTLEVTDYLKKLTTMLLLNAPLSVDVFFVISGILNTYSYLNSTNRASKTFLGHIIGYVHRYVRLTPAYALMMLVTATWLYRLGSGPYWDVLMGDARYACTTYWWSGLVYINNYYNPSENCMLQSWYLAVDMQLFWLSPIVLYSLWRWPRVGLLKLAVLIVVSIIIPFYVAWVDKIKAPIPLTLNTEEITREMNELYMPTHTKTISYVLGMVGGYFLIRVKRDHITFHINRTVSVGIWILAVLSMAWGVFGGYNLFQLDTEYDRLDSSLYIAFYKFFWSLGIVWIIVACSTGNGGFINTVLSLRMWMPLGRLTYCIYLTHAAVILYNISGLRLPQYFSYHTMVMSFLGEFMIAILAATLLSLTIESPIMALEKVLRGGNRIRQRPSAEGKAEERVSEFGINLPNALTQEDNYS